MEKISKNGAKRADVLNFVNETYGTKPEYLWQKYPNYAVFRHSSGKWFGVVMDIEKNKLGLEGEDKIDILVAKCDSLLRGSLQGEHGFLPAYHMNKEHWITILLDGTVEKEKVFQILDLSYETLEKPKNKLN